MRRLSQPFARDCPHRFLNPSLQIHIELWWKSPQRLDDVLGILGAAEMDTVAFAGSTQENQAPSWILKRRRDRQSRLQKADDSHHRRREDRFTERFVIKTYVAASDRDVEK